MYFEKNQQNTIWLTRRARVLCSVISSKNTKESRIKTNESRKETKNKRNMRNKWTLYDKIVFQADAEYIPFFSSLFIFLMLEYNPGGGGGGGGHSPIWAI